MKNTFIAVILLFSASAFVPAKAQDPSQIKLPLDKEVRSGVLDNGLTYYIMHNEEPKERASFYMIQNVGAILEEDNQNGLAHYLEHMAFNGTKHFPGKGILNTLEKHGVAFGYNINAYTAQDETVYNLSEVPTNKPGLIDTCLLVLNDWSNYLLLSGEEIEAERGVISEEWRTRRTASFRMYRESLPYIFNNSKYAERDVIGDLDVIKNFKHEELREFYHDWYRTDLQAIAVVGDFDVDEVEQKVLDLFSKIPAVENAKERSQVLIPENEDVIFGLVTDPEADQSSISIYIRQYIDEPGIENVNQLRESYIESLFNRMISQRISELLQKGDPPFVVGTIARSSLTKHYDLTYIRTIAKTNEEQKALSAILEEAERARRFGFTQGELDRAKLHLLNRMENLVKEKDKITNDQYARGFRAHYIDGEAYMDIEEEYQIMQALFSSINIEDLSDRMDGWFTQKNMVMIIQGPEGEDISHLSREEALGLLAESRAKDLSPYDDIEVATTLINKDLNAGTIVSEKAIPGLEAKEWKLSNGAKVIYRFADYEKDQVSFTAYSPGGSSLYESDYVPSMDMLTNLITFYGLGDYDQSTLQKILTGKTVSLSLQLNSLSEGMSGSASPEDMEILMQMIYLRFMEPRFDEEAHGAIISRYMAYVENMNKNPQKIMSDSLNLILTDHHERTRVMNADFIQDVELEKIEKVYRERFTDASDFTFFFVGNIEEEEMKGLVTEYIAGLPSIYRKETWIDREINEPEGEVEQEISMKLSVPKSTVFVIYNQEMDYTPENLLKLRVLKGILDLRFVETIREEEGGSYGVSVDGSLSHFPKEKVNLFIMFDTDPEKADYLKDIVYRELELLAKDGPSQKDLNKALENMLKEREESKEHNAYWLRALTTLYRHNYNPDDPANFEEIVSGISNKDMKKFMKKLLKDPNIIDLVFSPEEVEEVSE